MNTFLMYLKKFNQSIDGYILFIFIYALLILKNYITPSFYYFWSITLTAIISFFIIKRLLNRKNSDVILIVFLTFIVFIVSKITKGGLIQTGSNNDIYNWGLSSNTISGFGNYSHIMPIGDQIWEGLKQDAFGAYIFNAVLPTVFFKNTLEFSLINMVVIILLKQIIFYKILIIGEFKRSTSILISILFIGNPLYLYLVSNYFLGQLLGELFILYAAFSYLYAKNHDFNTTNRVILTFPWVFLSLISYQSGFIPHLILGLFIVATIYYGMSANSKIWSLPFAFNRLVELVIDLLIIIGLCALLYPPLIIHFYEQSMLVAKVIAGWSLPTQNPLMLLGWPIISTVQEGWAKNQIFSIVILLLTAAIILKDRIKKYFYILLFWVFLYLIYFLVDWLLPREVNYQYWKAVSYILLPLGFIVTASIVDNLLFNKKMKFLFFLSSYLIVAISFNNSYRKQFFSYSHVYKNLSQLVVEGDLPKLVLNTDDWGDTFIAFNTLSRDNLLYPVNKWYGPSVNFMDIDFPFDSYVDRNCSLKNNPTEKYRLVNKNENMDYFFGIENCGLLSKMLTWDNLYTLEPTGRWSKGSVLNFNLAIPKYLNDRTAKITFDVRPFLPPGIKTHNFDLYLDNSLIHSYSIQDSTQIVIPLILKSSKPSKITFKFNKTGRPSDFIVGSNDTRDVALFFVSAKLSQLTNKP
jgi:hypothetical protein